MDPGGVDPIRYPTIKEISDPDPAIIRRIPNIGCIRLSYNFIGKKSCNMVMHATISISLKSKILQKEKYAGFIPLHVQDVINV